MIKDFRDTVKYRNFLTHLRKGSPMEKEIVNYIDKLEEQIMELERMVSILENDHK